jgi:hypothetical protein
MRRIRVGNAEIRTAAKISRAITRKDCFEKISHQINPKTAV